MPDGPKTGDITLSPRGGFVMPSDAAMGIWHFKHTWTQVHIMNYDDIINSLNKYRQDEIIYRDFYVNPTVSSDTFRSKYPDNSRDVDIALNSNRIPY